MENTIFYENITQYKGFQHFIPIVLLVIIIIFIVVLIIGIIHAVKYTSIAIKDNEVIIKSFLYGRKIPIKDIQINETRTINLNQESDYNISFRTNGISLTNFHSGWMKLRNGQKALVFLTNKENVLFMPVKDFIVLFSMEKVEEFIRKLKE
ncbi:MAG: PH domain-containing protein [Treponema sp.]|nr:PH domain-containing protein [Treponema sp.]MCL2251904.1 PH domain-containing protein [Treponema sp.]